MPELFANPNPRHFAALILLGVILNAGLLAIVALVLRHQGRPDRLREGLARLPRLPWHDADALTLLGVFIGSQFGIALLTAPLGRLAGMPTASLPAFALGLQTLLLPAAGFACAWWLARRRGLPLRRLLLPPSLAGWWRGIGFGVLAYLAMMPLVGAGTYVWTEALRAVNVPVGRQPVVDILLGGGYPMWLRLEIMILATTLVPAFEELLFRGVILPLALRRTTPGRAITAAAFIFAALHLHAPSVGPLFVVACALSLATARSGSLLAPIVMHGLFNGVSLVTMVLLRDAPYLLPP